MNNPFISKAKFMANQLLSHPDRNVRNFAIMVLAMIEVMENG